jgi:hypothetical protein
MTRDPGQFRFARAPAGPPEARRERWPTWLLRKFGPYVSVFGVVFGGALLAMGDDPSKIVGACLILPSGLLGHLLLVSSALRTSHTSRGGMAGN